LDFPIGKIVLLGFAGPDTEELRAPRG